MPAPIAPDTKDWTWVLDRPCPDCGFDATAVERTSVAERLRANAVAMAARLQEDDASTRPDPQTWSPLEYACHVRDVHRVFGERVQLMATRDDPLFDNWDQDAAALEGRYADQEVAEIGPALVNAAETVAQRYDAVTDWTRPGRRSNGSIFTVESLARYHLHDVVHHAHDVGAR